MVSAWFFSPLWFGLVFDGKCPGKPLSYTAVSFYFSKMIYSVGSILHTDYGAKATLAVLKFLIIQRCDFYFAVPLCFHPENGDRTGFCPTGLSEGFSELV